MRGLASLGMAVIAWWFLGYAGHKDGAATHGPFVDRAQCEQIRAWFTQHIGSARTSSWCWWDGRP